MAKVVPLGWRPMSFQSRWGSVCQTNMVNASSGSQPPRVPPEWCSAGKLDQLVQTFPRLAASHGRTVSHERLCCGTQSSRPCMPHRHVPPLCSRPQPLPTWPQPFSGEPINTTFLRLTACSKSQIHRRTCRMQIIYLARITEACSQNCVHWAIVARVASVHMYGRNLRLPHPTHRQGVWDEKTRVRRMVRTRYVLNRKVPP